MSYVALTLAALAASALLLRAFVRSNTHTLAQNARTVISSLLLLVAGYLLIRGSIAAAITLATVGFGILLASLPSRIWKRGLGEAAPTRTSRVTTEHLELELDLDTGEMRGRVIKGFFQGRSIDRLRPVELAHLWQDCRFTDPQSAQLVEAYLDRIHPSWRDDLARAEAESPKGPDGKMPMAEALDILGLTAEASIEDIRRAHRDLMLRLHPDRGGSTYLAAKINEAKDVALREKSGGSQQPN